jgi:hypothetical protein
MEMESRQVQRAQFRAEVKRGQSLAKVNVRKKRQKELLERQTAREKAGAYTGRGTKAAVAKSRSRINARTVKKGHPFGRVLVSYTEDEREISFHATKGWRDHRA